jgi:Tol biopolymer transport system component
MRTILECWKHIFFLSIFFYTWFCVLSLVQISQGSQPADECEPPVGPYDKSVIDLKAIPFKIIYETCRETDGKENWELFIMNADGSNATNLTRTPEVDELYPHASPDGTRVCFVLDKGTSRRDKIRSVYYMNIDGTNRVKVADHAQWPCWSPDGKTIAYLKCEYERNTTRERNTKELMFYDVQSGTHRQHPNKLLHHLYNICWSANGNWFVATVHGGMGFQHSIIAFEANGTRVFDLKKYGIEGCRPDLSPDGRSIGWGEISEVDVFVADIDLTYLVPRVTDLRSVAKCKSGNNTNLTDFSPDGQYIAFGYGPEVDYSVGDKAPGWNICVGDMTGKWVQVTTDGKHNKEPDWVPVAGKSKP